MKYLVKKDVEPTTICPPNCLTLCPPVDYDCPSVMYCPFPDGIKTTPGAKKTKK